MHRISKARFLALGVAALLLSTCGDDAGDPKAIFVEMAGDIQAAEAKGLTSNEELFASADAMMPAINAIIHPLTSSTSTGPCLPEGTGGKLYTFDGVAYSGEADAGIPQSTARFRLYELDGLGQPILSQAMGHIDFTCFDVGSALTEVQLARGTTLVVSTTVSQINGQINGIFRDEAMTHPTPFAGKLYPGDRLSLSFEVSERFSALMEASNASGPGPVKMTVHDREGDEEGGYTAAFGVDANQKVTVGTATLMFDYLDHAVACINAGTVEVPVFNAPDEDCVPYTDGGIVTVNAEQLNAMSDSYQSLRHLWLTAAKMVDLCRSLVPPDTN